MSIKFNSRQKSLKRRFLLILGIATFICVVTMGLMVMFWTKVDFGFSQTYRYLVGGIFILYGIIRFGRLFKKDDEE